MRRRIGRIVGVVATILLLVGSVLLAAITWPRNVAPASAEEVTSVPVPGQKVVYLTFDAGNAPDNTVTPLLELLAREKLPATFFLTGKWTVQHPASARSIADAGYLLASHSFTHPYMTKSTPQERFLEMRGTELAVRAVCGRDIMLLWRPPNGDTNAEVDAQMAMMGYRTIMWSRDAHDWPLTYPVTVGTIQQHLGNIQAGDVCVFHLRNMATVDALKVIIPALKKQGFTFRDLHALGK
jgi:peptidoglycan/xylan/chitin deacetylase (PgdA/CDA1 family)